METQLRAALNSIVEKAVWSNQFACPLELRVYLWRGWLGYAGLVDVPHGRALVDQRQMLLEEFRAPARPTRHL